MRALKFLKHVLVFTAIISCRPNEDKIANKLEIKSKVRSKVKV